MKFFFPYSSLICVVLAVESRRKGTHLVSVSDPGQLHNEFDKSDKILR